jgi:hypothetical protein
MESRRHSGKPALSPRQDFPLLECFNLHHPLIVLAELIDWTAIDQVAYETIGPRHLTKNLELEHLCVWQQAASIRRGLPVDTEHSLVKALPPTL